MATREGKNPPKKLLLGREYSQKERGIKRERERKVFNKLKTERV